MMQKLNWRNRLILILIIGSAAIYFLHYLIFRDIYHIFIYMIGDIAFLPIEVLLVTLIINEVLNAREKRKRLGKLSMVIGAFFNEIGTDLLIHFSNNDPGVERLQEKLCISPDWSDKDFNAVQQDIMRHEYEVDMEEIDLQRLKDFMTGKRDFIMGVLVNPSLLEHETFTKLLQAISHLTEELHYRKDFTTLPESDINHLSVDITRAYTHLVREWVDYMQHLKNKYPYLFSLAMRTNPFDLKASPIV